MKSEKEYNKVRRALDAARRLLSIYAAMDGMPNWQVCTRTELAIWNDLAAQKAKARKVWNKLRP